MRSNECARTVLNAMALPSEVGSRNRKTSATPQRATFGFSGSSSKSGRACTARATAAETAVSGIASGGRLSKGASLCWKARIPRQHLTYFVQSGQFPPPCAPRAQPLVRMAEGRAGDPEAGPAPRGRSAAERPQEVPRLPGATARVPGESTHLVSEVLPERRRHPCPCWDECAARNCGV